MATGGPGGGGAKGKVALGRASAAALQTKKVADNKTVSEREPVAVLELMSVSP
jgi:hypothetical protein